MPLPKAEKLTVCEQFVKDHCFVDEKNRCGYITGICRNPIPEDVTSDDFLNTNIKDKKMLEIGQNRTSILLRVRIRFINSIAAGGSNGPRIFLKLREYLQEDAVRQFFPGAWLLFKERMDEKARQTQKCRKGFLRNKTQKDHRDIARHTAGMSIRQAGRSSRNFS